MDFSYPNKVNSMETKNKHTFKVNDELLGKLVESKYRNIFTENLANEDVDKFYDNILNLLSEVDMPRKISNRVSPPWYNFECYKLKKKLNEWRECLDRAEIYNWDTSVIRPHFVNLKREYKSVCNNKKRLFIKAKEEATLKEAEENKCYKILSLSKNFYNSNNIMMDEWEKVFERIFNEKELQKDESLKLKDTLLNYSTNVDFTPIMHEEIILAIKKMKNGKSPGPDCVKNENVKLLATVLLPEITKFFNLCLSKGTYPKIWKEARL